MIALIVVLPFLSALLMALVYLQNTDAKRYTFFTSVGVLTPSISAVLSLLTLFALINGADTIHYTLLSGYILVI